ncbi:MAG TPA: MAPEG family protein [Candidatus Acidoferrum sp.]|nr:MAPEG family protein [Candidatus Acidoferrum sp.]
MGDGHILFPMLALMGWTFLVLIQIPIRRFRAGFQRRVSADDFKYGESARVPGDVSLPNRNLMNLLEVPVIFYFVCVLYYVTHQHLGGFVFLAWLYVALRVMHSLIHLSYNHVRHRLLPFAASNAVVITLWLRLTLALVLDNA